MGDPITTGLLIVFGGIAILWLSGVAYSTTVKDRSLPRSAGNATGYLFSAVAAAIGLTVTGLANFGQFVDVGTHFVANHIILATNGFTALLGWLGIAGLVAIDSTTFLVVVIAGVTLALIIKEVRS
ncbi:MAG: hypothetical protein ABEI77_07575 [Halorientalis sp.]